MLIRPMEVRDHGPLRALYLASRRSAFGWLAPDSFKLADFDADVAGETVWVAQLGEAVAGFASVWEPENFLHTLFVDPGLLRRGAGKALLAACVAHRRPGAAAMTLKCLVRNRAALDFYAAHGWRQAGRGGSPEGDFFLLRFEPGA